MIVLYDECISWIGSEICGNLWFGFGVGVRLIFLLVRGVVVVLVVVLFCVKFLKKGLFLWRVELV